MKKNFMAPKRVKGKPGSKKREKCIIVFDDKEREEFLTGFHKRKVERRKAAVVEIKNKIKEEQKKVREERQKEYIKMLKERNEALEEDEDELEDHITATTESVQYDHPNHTVTVTTISDLDLTGGGLLGLPSNQASGGQDEEKEEGEEREEAEDEKITMPKKAFDPILNKKICSLTASLHAHSTKHREEEERTQEGRGRDQPPDRKSGAKDRKSGAKDKKSRQVFLAGCDEREGAPSGSAMPLAGVDLVCPGFQPNIFDASRCHDCLRQKRLHAAEGAAGAGTVGTAGDTGTSTALGPGSGPGSGSGSGLGPRLGPGPVEEPKPGSGLGLGLGLGLGSGSGLGLGLELGLGSGSGAGTVVPTGSLLTRLPRQTEERDGSTKGDSDGLWAVSSGCDVRGGHRGGEESSLCILSPDCELYICDGDDDSSTDSCLDHSDYPELSGSVSTEDDFPPVRRRPPPRPSMTRLDRPAHRPSPRVWMEEAQSRGVWMEEGRGRGSFGGGRSDLKGDRDHERDRESGYSSLGRSEGARVFRDKGLPSDTAPYRHLERGHPLRYGDRGPEPKDAVPFRNPNLGVASERLIPELLDQDLPPESPPPPPPPDPYEIAVEVEAQVGPRSPSPTPFKIAESLASSGGRRGLNNGSYGGRGNAGGARQQTGRFDSSRQGSALPSRSSSPSRSEFRRSESAASLNRRGFEGGGWSQGRDQTSRSPAPGSYGRGAGSGTLPRNFKSSPGSVRAQPNSFTDFKSSLRRVEANGSLSDRARDASPSSSPSRRGYDGPSQPALRKAESVASLNGRGRQDPSSSPSPRSALNGRVGDGRNSSPSRRSYDPPGQSLLRKAEILAALNVRGRPGRRCGSPIREGYDIESQIVLKTEMQNSRNGENGREDESPSPAPSRKGFDTQSQSLLRKSESSSYGNSGGRDSRSVSPSRRGYEPPGPSLLRKSDANASVRGHGSSLTNRGREAHNSAPTRKDYDPPGQSSLRNRGSGRSQSRDSHSPSPSRRGHEAPSQSVLRKSETGGSVRSHSRDGRGSSPSRRGHDPPGQSVLRKSDTSGSVRGHGRDGRVSPPSRGRGYEAPGQSLLRKTETGGSARSHNRDSRGPSPSRRGYDSPGQSVLRKSETNSSVKSHGRDGRSSSPSRRSYDPPGQSVLRKSETSIPGRSRDGRSPPPSRGGYEAPGQSQLRKSDPAGSLNSRGSSPSRRGHSGEQSAPRKTGAGANSGSSYQRKSAYSDPRTDSAPPPPASWRDSAHSRRSSSQSRAAFSHKDVVMDTAARGFSGGGGGRRGPEARSSSPLDDRRPSLSHRRTTRSPSPSHVQRHTSSQSSLESSESGQGSAGSGGRSREEYAMMADLPKVKTVLQREGLGHVTQNRPMALFKPASHSVSRHPAREAEPELDRDPTAWHHGGSGRMSRAHSPSSLHSQVGYVSKAPSYMMLM